MRFHKEGNTIILISSILVLLVLIPIWIFLSSLLWLSILISIVMGTSWILVMQFFRNPVRTIEKPDAGLIYAPADGEVVVIEETEETEILGKKCIQISIFMSPLNVHVNRHPVSGKISYYRYHPGAFLMAWNPKASTDNERTTIVYDLPSGEQILVRQIAGFMARRIICYAKEGMETHQGEELGFIRFGSRVDVYLPVGTNVLVKIGDKSIGNKTILARI